MYLLSNIPISATGNCCAHKLWGFWTRGFSNLVSLKQKLHPQSVREEFSGRRTSSKLKLSAFKTTSSAFLPVSTSRGSRCSSWKHSTVKKKHNYCLHSSGLNVSMEMFEANTGKDTLKTFFLMWRSREAGRFLLRHSSCPAAADRTDRGNNKAGCFDSCGLVLPRPGLHRSECDADTLMKGII